MSSLTGFPGSIFFLMPSRPAAQMAAKARYGLAEGSGVLNSALFLFSSDAPLW
jgi:hypothetical protein